MKEVEWTGPGLQDLARLFDFLARYNVRAAAELVDRLTSAPERLREHPRLGQQIERYMPRDVRRLVVGSYEIRYEIKADFVLVLRVFHGKEDRN